MNILYSITILGIYILFMLMHKTDKKQNLITWCALSSILVICYNILVSLIYTFIGILCTLQNLSIFNIVILVIFSTILLKTKKTQKYYLKKSDLAFAIILLILTMFIGYKQYGFPFNIKYEITDGSTHYFFAQQFYENSTMLYNEVTDDILRIYNADFRLPGAYVNEGILFKIFDGIALQTDLFVLFDLFVLYLSGILIFSLLKTYTKENKIISILAMVFSIIYMFGYQLNSMLYGYVYLSLALDIIIALLLLLINYPKEEINSMIALPILALLSFGIFFTYAYFIPIIYISIIINIVIESMRNKEKIIGSNNIVKVIYIIVIPAILGISYFIIFPLINGTQTEISTIGTEGHIYQNYITNYLFFIPILLAEIILFRKKKEYYFSTILFIWSILFAIILFVGQKFNIVSTYYFFKAYYIIWLLAILETFIGISSICNSNFKKKWEIITYIYIGTYIISILLPTLAFRKNIGINDIFYNNIKCIQNDSYIVENEEIKIIEKAKKIAGDNEIYVLAPRQIGRAEWLSVLHHNQLIFIDYMTVTPITIEKWLADKEEKYYLAYHKEYKEEAESTEYLEENNPNYKIIYNDEYAFVLERTIK